MIEEMIDLDKILEQVKGLSQEVGDFILTERKSFDRSKMEIKGLNDLVSYVDKEAEKMLVSRLSSILPEAGFIAEEGTSSKKGERYNWIVDPLDGTTNFIHGLPVFSISIALVDGKETILGLVHELNHDECFYAIKGSAAYCNLSQISVSETNQLAESLVATGFPYTEFHGLDDYLEILQAFMKKSHGVRRLGSAAVDLAYVACGRFEGFYEYNLNAWDVAAGAFIVQQAGGTVTDFHNGNDYIFGREIIAAGSVHAQILSEIKEHWKN